MKTIRNADVVEHEWVGVTFSPSRVYEIPETEIWAWSNNSEVLSAITDGLAIVGDGDNDFTDAAQAIKFLAGIQQTFKLDPTTGQVLMYNNNGLPDNSRTVFQGCGDDCTQITFKLTANDTSKTKIISFNHDVYIKDGIIVSKDAPLGSKVCMEIWHPVLGKISYFVKCFNLLGSIVYNLESEGGRALLPAGMQVRVTVTNSDGQGDNDSPCEFRVTGALEMYRSNNDI
jgi:hypothetical protein